MIKNINLHKSQEIYDENNKKYEKDDPNFLLSTKKFRKNNKRGLEKKKHSINNVIMNNCFKKYKKKVLYATEKKKKKYDSNNKFQDSENLINDKISSLVNENEIKKITSNNKYKNNNNNLSDMKKIKNGQYSKKKKINKIEDNILIKKNKANKNIEKNILKKIKNKKNCNNNKSSKIENQVLGISQNIYNILNILNLPKSDILKRTNQRFAESFLYLTNGYNVDIEKLFKGSMYKRKYRNNSTIKITGIQIYSLCKHHLLPFQGVCTIEYIPNRYILGLSKFSRIVDAFSRRLQLQEDLTNDICNILKKYLKPLHVQVTIVAEHLCISMRGVKEHNSTTITHARNELKNNKYINNSYIDNCFQKENDISMHDDIN
ncbi:GTP cyclohydrolase I, putative [Plasmodium relictum]|uniref:GTP cyclohydrolase 1 n=1 Tax=Plasmodium relictum TaxID=85471 RepID=A0A1J1HC39_PLARL|nr:GTP cyclohydrolase I, putative [Plasmodium relictum]CRH02662.1 GTP cyclohydrolase I, putative [Plasmodium relictum]